MARLPQPGRDADSWGEILNEFLSVDHNNDGTLKITPVVNSKYTLPVGGIPATDLSATVQASLGRADSAVQSVAGKTGFVALTPDDVSLGSSSTPTFAGLGLAALYTGITDTSTMININPTIAQSGTAGYTSLLVNVTENSTGTGAKLLTDLQVGGNTAFRVSNTGEARFAAPGTPANYGSIKTDAYWTRVGGSGASGWTFDRELNINSVLTFGDGKNMQFGTGTGTKFGTNAAQKIGFFNATPIARPTVTGSRGGNAALASLLTQLANLGLVNDDTTA